MTKTFKFLFTVSFIILVFGLSTGILDHYSIKYSQENQEYNNLYNKNISTYSSKKTDLSYYKSGLYVKTVAREKYGLIEANDDPNLISYSKIIRDKNTKSGGLTVIMDLFTSRLSADEIEMISSY